MPQNKGATMNHTGTHSGNWLRLSRHNHSFAPRAMKSGLLVSTLVLAIGNYGAAAESLNPLPLAMQEQIAALKKQNQEMHEQIEALKRQSRWTSSSRQAGDSAAPPVVMVTNG